MLLETIRKHINYSVSTRLRGNRFRVPVWGGIEALGVCVTSKTEVIARYSGLREGTFIDVGVNLGQTLLDVRACSPEVAYVGFEPNPACVGYVRRLIAANRFSNCTVIPTALSSTVGLVPLYHGPNQLTDPASTLIANLRPHSRNAEAQWVPTMVFDVMAPVIGIEAVCFVKVDVEGAELEVLQGMRETLGRDRPPVLVEVLPQAGGTTPEQTEARRAAILGLMNDLGYWPHHVVLEAVGTLNLRPIERFLPGPFDPNVSWDYLFLPR
jgi:FkbM family methyltransferase